MFWSDFHRIRRVLKALVRTMIIHRGDFVKFYPDTINPSWGINVRGAYRVLDILPGTTNPPTAPYANVYKIATDTGERWIEHPFIYLYAVANDPPTDKPTAPFTIQSGGDDQANEIVFKPMTINIRRKDGTG